MVRNTVRNTMIMMTSVQSSYCTSQGGKVMMSYENKIRLKNWNSIFLNNIHEPLLLKTILIRRKETRYTGTVIHRNKTYLNCKSHLITWSQTWLLRLDIPLLKVLQKHKTWWMQDMLTMLESVYNWHSLLPNKWSVIVYSVSVIVLAEHKPSEKRSAVL